MHAASQGLLPLLTVPLWTCWWFVLEKRISQNLDLFFSPYQILHCRGYRGSSSALTASCKWWWLSLMLWQWWLTSGQHHGALHDIMDLLMASCSIAASPCTSLHLVPTSGVELWCVTIIRLGFLFVCFYYLVLTEQIWSSLQRGQLWIRLTKYLSPRERKVAFSELRLRQNLLRNLS